MGFKHLLRQTDEKIASKEAGLDLRPVTTSEIQSHLDDFGLAQECGTYGKIRGLSGGQKVKLVLAAAMWNCKCSLLENISPCLCAHQLRLMLTHTFSSYEQAHICWYWMNLPTTSTVRH